MAQKKGQYDMQDLVVEGTNQPASSLVQKGQYSPRDIVKPPDTKGQLEALTSTTPQSLEPGSVADIANPVASATGTSTTSLPRSGLNLLGALGAGAEEAVGIDPNNQLGSLPGALYNQGKGLFNAMTTASGAIDAVKGMYHGVVDSPSKMKTARENSDPDAYVSGLGGMGVTTIPAVTGVVGAAKEPIGNAVANIRNRPEPILNPVSGEQVSTMPRRPRTGLFSNEISPRTQFSQSNPPPYASDLAKASGGEKAYWLRDRLEDTTQLAKDDLLTAERDVLKAPVQNAEEYYRILPEAKKAVWNEYQQYLDKGTPIAGDMIVKRAISNIPDEVRLNHPNDYANIVKDLQDRYGGKTYDARTAQTMLEGLNSDAKTFYKQSNTDRASASKTPAAAKWEAPADALRSLMDESLPQGGSGVRRRYGALSELMDEMPSPSEEGTGFIKGMVKKSAQAMSTRPGYAFMRGAMRQLQETSSDALVKRAFNDMRKEGISRPNQPVPNTHPLTTPQTQGAHPLAVQPHPMATVPQIMTGDSNYGEAVIQNSAPRPAIPPQLESINGKSQYLPHELESPQIQPSERPHVLSGLDVNQFYGPLPAEAEAAARNLIPDSAPHSPIPTGLNTTGYTNDTMLPGQEAHPTPLTHALTNVGYSSIEPVSPTRSVPGWRGMPASNPLYGNGTPAELNVSKAPLNNSPSDVRYQGVRPANVPADTMNLMNRGAFSTGLPSSGMPIQTPAPETLGKLGEKIGKNKIKTGLRK